LAPLFSSPQRRVDTESYRWTRVRLNPNFRVRTMDRVFNACSMIGTRPLLLCTPAVLDRLASADALEWLCLRLSLRCSAKAAATSPGERIRQAEAQTHARRVHDWRFGRPDRVGDWGKR